MLRAQRVASGAREDAKKGRATDEEEVLQCVRCCVQNRLGVINLYRNVSSIVYLVFVSSNLERVVSDII